MPSRLARIALFASAYAPLLVLFAILGSFGSNWSSWLCVAVATTSTVVTWLYWRTVIARQGDWLTSVHSRPRDADVLNFFVTYVVPFAVAPLNDTRARIALLFFLLFIGALYLRANLFQIHPLLLLAGYHLYEVDLSDNQTVAVMTRKSFVPQAGQIRAVPLMPNVYVETS